MRASSAFLLVACVLVAGCAGSKDGSSTSPTPTGRVPSAPHLTTANCDEVNVIETKTATGGEVPAPLHARPHSNSNGFLIDAVETFQHCASIGWGATNASDPVLYYRMIPVGPVTNHEIPGVASYYYVGLVAGSVDIAAKAFAYAAIPTANATITLAYADFNGKSKASATAHVQRGAETADYSTLMTSDEASGKAGALGLYTVNATSLRGHRLNFTDYHLYAQGTASDTVRRPPIVRAANHNLGYGLDIEFDAIPATPLSSFTGPAWGS